MSQSVARSVTMSSRGRSMSRGSSRSSRSRASSRSRSVKSTLVEPLGRALGDRRRMAQSIYFDPFPSMMRNKLKYCANVIITTVNGSDDGVPHYFSCNGIHDPDVSGVGHQPYGHDTLASLYNHYSVDKAVIKVRPSTTANQIIWGVALTDDTSTPTADNVLLERKTSRYSVMPQADQYTPETLSLAWKPDASFPVVGAQKNLNAAYGSNPGEQMFFMVFVKRPINGLSQVSLSFDIQIEYSVTSYELKQLSQN